MIDNFCVVYTVLIETACEMKIWIESYMFEDIGVGAQSTFGGRGGQDICTWKTENMCMKN